MAVYGFPPPGGVSFTGYTNTLGNGPANADATGGTVYYNGLTQGDDRLAKMFRNGGATLNLRRVITTLLGAAVGGVAVQTKVQIQGQQGSPGGLIPLETITLMNRATTANDMAAVNALMFRTVFPASYPVDVSGNGGGGKQDALRGAY